MAKDYGRTRKRRGNQGSRQFLQIVMAFSTGYLAASLFDFASLTHWVNSKISEQQKPKIQQPEMQTEIPKPKFEFYTLLAKGREVAPVTPMGKTEITAVPQLNQPTSEIKSPTKATPTIKENWTIQVGSFRTKPEAERMKAGLLLKGYSVQVVANSQTQGVWFRVLLGPYPSESEAKQVQLSFSKNEKIIGMIRKV